MKKVSDSFNNTVKLAGNSGNTDTQKLSQTGGLSFGVVGANNGQYIKTTAAGTDVVADLSDDAKTKLNKTYTVSSGSTNVTVTPTTVGDNTDFKISVTNTPAGGASSTESVVKKLMQLAILTWLTLLLKTVKTLAIQMLNTPLMFPVML